LNVEDYCTSSLAIIEVHIISSSTLFLLQEDLPVPPV